jgi:hypothetical protein
MKINPTIYRKLLAQAEEAKSQGLLVLAEGILSAIGPYPDEEKQEYTYSQMKNDIHSDMWKMATRLMYYYDIKSADAAKLDENLMIWCSEMLDNLESALDVSTVVKGPLEPKLPGEDK